jgi:tetratricopeptide (TPR) repeat protein
MRNITRLFVVLALFWLAYVLFGKAQAAYSQEEVDATRIVMLFGGMLLVALAAGSFFVVSFLPDIGEGVGNFFFNPNEPVQVNPHGKALAAVACGDYRGAIREYQEVFEKDPTDTLALSEITHLYCDKLHEPAPAAELLEKTLGREWLAEDAAFLTSRLVDVYWHHQGNLSRARELLLQVIELLPGTKHAANAQHRLHEIDRQAAMQG